VILTGIYGNDSTVTFENIEGSGEPQWVSFYYQSTSAVSIVSIPLCTILTLLLDTDDLGFGDQRKYSSICCLGPGSGSDILIHSIAGGTPDRIGGSWQLRRISSVVVNGDPSSIQTLYQRDTHKGIILSTPLQLTLKKGKRNTITVGGLYNGFDHKGADLDRIVVYPIER
jgi:hypothetical protein